MVFLLGSRADSAGYRLATFERLGSTNTEALAQARAGERGPLWFVALEQTAGRGRRHRPWIAPRGNLYSSVLELIDVSPAVAATLGFAAGLAVETALRQLSTEAVLRSAGSETMNFRVKWPNDVLCGLGKLTGILLEAEAVAEGGLAVVVGIGTNVVSAPQGTPTPAACLAELGVNASAEDLFSAQSDAWAEYRGIWDNGAGFGEIRRKWLERAAGLGGPVSVQAGSSMISGIFDTIDEAGCLIVATPDGKRIPVSAGDVHFGNAASAGAA